MITCVSPEEEEGETPRARRRRSEVEVKECTKNAFVSSSVYILL
jgi:hypothetical protein